MDEVRKAQRLQQWLLLMVLAVCCYTAWEVRSIRIAVQSQEEIVPSQTTPVKVTPYGTSTEITTFHDGTGYSGTGEEFAQPAPYNDNGDR